MEIAVSSEVEGTMLRGVIAIAIVAAAGCLRSVSPGEMDAAGDAATDAPNDASTDGSSPDDGSQSDATSTSCSSIMVFDEVQATYGPWGVGAPGDCAAFGLEISNTTRPAAEAAYGGPCAASLCIIVAPKTGPLTTEQLERACSMEAALGPQVWHCKYE